MAISLNVDKGTGLTGKVDTLAQSFLVDRQIYVTKLDLFFSKKSGNLPIGVSLRRIENDSPSANIIPNSQVSLDIDDVKISANSLVATTITFPMPVFLESGEYCFTLASDTKLNQVYTASLGGQDIATNAIISKQPYTGVMFMSSNGNQWNIDQTRDIKFKLYRAKFTETNAIVDLKLEDLNLDKYDIEFLEKDKFKTYDKSDIVRIFHENHGFADGRYVKLNGITGSLDVLGNANSVVTINGIPFEKLDNVIFQVSNVTSSGYTIGLNLTSGEKANVVGGSFPYSGAMVTTCLPYSTLVSGISEIVPLKTTTSHYVKTTDEALQVSEFEPIEFGTVSFSETQLLVDQYNRNTLMSGKESLLYRIELSTNDEYVSPVINVPYSSLLFVSPDINDPGLDDNLTVDNILIANASSNVSFTFSNTTGFVNISDITTQSNVKTLTKGAFVTISGATANNTGTFRITNVAEDGSYFEVPNVETEPAGNAISILYRPMYIADEASKGTSSKAKYITRKISTAKPSRAFNVRMTLTKPAGSDIEIYYKTQINNESSSTFETKEYTKLDIGEIQNTLQNQFIEIESTIDGLIDFNSFVFKLVLKSNSIATYPTISDLRVIALQ